MSKKQHLNGLELFERIKVMSNLQRFHILELTEHEQLTVTELSSKLKLTYSKCADYVRIMEEIGLVQKIRVGKEVRVESKVKLRPDKIEFVKPKPPHL